MPGQARFTEPLKPSYPILALEDRDEAKLVVHLDVSPKCEVERISFVSNSAPEKSTVRTEFEKEVTAAIRANRLHCAGTAPYTLPEQVVNFSLADVTKSMQSDEVRSFRSGLQIVRPVYPREGFTYNADAVVIAQMVVDAQCRISAHKVLFVYVPIQQLPTEPFYKKRLYSSFEAATLFAIKRWRFEGSCPISTPFLLEQPIVFRVTGFSLVDESFRQQAQIPLVTFLSMVKDTPAFRRKLSTRGTCPTAIMLKPMQPYSPNRVQPYLVTDAMPPPEVTDWLSGLELQEKYKLSFLGGPMFISIPCVDFDFR